MDTNFVDEKGMRRAELICVIGGQNNNNKFYRMEQINEHTFKATWGRVEGGTPSSKEYPMRDWEKTHKSKTQRSKEPYKDVTSLRSVVVGAASVTNTKYRADRPKIVAEFAELLQAYQKKSVAQNYTVSVAQVTEQQVKEAQNKLNEVIDAVNKKKAELADELIIELYHIIPRKMKKVADHQFTSLSSKSDIDRANQLITAEQDALDAMAGQVSTQAKNSTTENGQVVISNDILDSLGIDFEDVSPAEIKMIKDLLGPDSSRFARAFRATNNTTQKAYDAHMKTAKDQKTMLMFHGSRNENWWSIVQKGLLIRPSNAAYTGSMFGDGIYFADKAAKSINYTSIHDAGRSYTGGGDNKAYLALYEVHVGKQHEVKHADYSLSLDTVTRKGCDSVFAKGGADLVNNEYIIYQAKQCTIRYVIEFGRR